MSLFSTTPKLFVSAAALVLTVGCEATPAPTSERAAASPTFERDPSVETVMSFGDLNAAKPALVEELMSLEPVMGRDRTYRFSQPVWAQASSMSVILRRLTDLEEPAHVRAALARALRTNRGPWHAEALELLRAEADAVVRARLMESLSDAPVEALPQALVVGLADADPRVRDWASVGASKLLANHPEAAVSDELEALLVQTLADEDQAVRAGIVRAISFRAELGLVEKVSARLGDSSPTVRLAAVDAIARLDPSGARARVLAAGLDKDEDPVVARAASRL